MPDLDDRLVNIELKITSQEDIIDDLNKTVYEQQKKIDQLENSLIAIAKQLKVFVEQNSDGPINERPPHY